MCSGSSSTAPVATSRDPGGRRRLGTPGAGFEPGTERLAEALAEHDEEVLAAFVDDAAGVPLAPRLARQTAAGLIHPVYFGSAVTGAGIDALVDGLATVLPPAHRTFRYTFLVAIAPTAPFAASSQASPIRRPI